MPTTDRLPLMEIDENDAPVASNGTATSRGANTRRKSGRAVKAPEKFVPDVFSSSQAVENGTAATSNKRKRGKQTADQGEDVENEEEEPEEQEPEDVDMESEEEASAAEEELRAKRRQKKKQTTRRPSAKKAKTNGDVPAVEKQSATPLRLPARPKKANKKVAIAAPDAEGLYAEVYTSGDSSEEVAAAWSRRYEENAPEAMADLVNFVLKSSGCPIKVTVDDINDPDNAPNRLTDIHDEYKEQTITDYPLISKAKSSQTFRSNLVGFFDALVPTLHESGVLYVDQASVLEAITIWIGTLSSSVLRPFRHTATVVCLAISTALCKITKEQADSVARLMRQLEGEQKRSKGGNKGRASTFQQQIDEGVQRREALDVSLKDFFDTIFVHRYKDVDPKIRTECAEALGIWIQILPEVFFEGHYLRYLGWMLSDSFHTTRQEVVDQLKDILKKEDNINGLRHFIDRFRKRIVEMATQDSEPAVRASSVALLEKIRQAGMMEPDEIDLIGKLIFDTEPRVRKAVVPFFAANIKDTFESKVEDLGGEDVLEEILSSDPQDYDSPRADWIKLKCLIEILQAYDSEDQGESPSQIEAATLGTADALKVAGMESRFALAAQALYDKMPEISDWEIIAGYLLYDHSAANGGTLNERALRQSFTLDENEEVVLLDIMNASVRHHLHQDEDHDNKSKKRKHARLESAEVQEATARALAGLIPRLLKKFGARPKAAVVVLRLEHVLNLGVFQELRQDSTAYKKLLDEISSQFSGHVDHGVLNEATASLLHARSYEELEEVTENKMQELWEDTLSTLQRAVGDKNIEVRGNLKTTQLTDLSNIMARIAKLAAIFDCIDILEANLGGRNRTASDSTPLATIQNIVARGAITDADPDIDDIEDSLVSSAVQTMLLYFMWKACGIQQAVAAGEPIPESDIDNLNEQQNTFSNNLIDVLSSRAGLDDLRLLATGTLLDLRTLLSTLRPSNTNNAPESHQYLQTIVEEIAPDVQKEITSIFAGLERQYAKKSRKTLEAPSEDDEPEDIDSDSDDEVPDTAAERQAEILQSEKKLCELTSKLVLSILARVIDVSEAMKGKLKARLQRNRSRLGANFREIVAFLDDKDKVKKGGRSKAQQKAALAQKEKENQSKMKSLEIVEDDDEEPQPMEEDEEEDPFADVGAGERERAEDLQRDIEDEEAPPLDGDDEEMEEGAGANGAGVEEDEDSIMGD